MSYYLSFNSKELARMNAKRTKGKKEKAARSEDSSTPSVARDAEKKNCQKKLLPEFVEAARTEDQGTASSSEFFIRNEEQISRGSNVAVEVLERKAEKRRASCQSQVPSKVNKTSGMFHVSTNSEENVTRVAGAQLPQQPVVTRETMIQKFMQQSQMNFKYSQECLEKNGWDYEKAGKNFMELKGNGSIPAEAFQI